MEEEKTRFLGELFFSYPDVPIPAEDIAGVRSCIAVVALNTFLVVAQAAANLLPLLLCGFHLGDCRAVFVSAAGIFKVANTPNQLLLVQEIDLIVGWIVDFASAIAVLFLKSKTLLHVID